MSDILVVPAEYCELENFKESECGKWGRVDNRWCDGFWTNGDNKENEEYLGKLLKHALFMNRDKAERDENFKQIIPYCILRDKAGSIFTYKRTPKGGEKRLHGLWSAGVGGHFSAQEDGKVIDMDMYWSGMHREIEEEVGLKEKAYFGGIEGFLYEDKTEVSKVHLGVIHILDIMPSYMDQLKFEDKALAQGSFENLSILTKNKSLFEGWSQIIINSEILIG